MISDEDRDAPSNDADLTLRHVTHRFPDDLARALLPDATSIDACVWLDTQLAARERRMDKCLRVVADGVARVEHIEWQTRWTRSLRLRMFEYHALTTVALHDAAKRGERIPRVRSTVVLLGGRRETPWPPRMRFRTSPRGDGFSGLTMRIEPVYQRTLAELTARTSPLWMVFAPLAADASPDTMRAVLDTLRRRTSRARFEELAVAMTVLADADTRRRGLRDIITAHLPEELVMQSWVYKQGVEKGQLNTLRQSIEVVLSARELKLTAARRAQLEAETRVDVLQRWLTRASTASRVVDVFAVDR